MVLLVASVAVAVLVLPVETESGTTRIVTIYVIRHSFECRVELSIGGEPFQWKFYLG